MSGPKVVRIVTLEEVKAICRRLMAQVDAGGSDLRRVAGRLGVLDASLEASLAARSRQLADMFAAGRWMELQKLAADILSFFPAERARLQTTAAARAEAARSRRRRLADGARAVAGALRAAGQPVPTELERVVTGASSASDEGLVAMEAAVGAALSRVPAKSADAGAARAASELAGRLSVGQATTTLADWLASRVTTPTRAEQRLDRLMAEFETFEGVSVASLRERLGAVAREESDARRALLTDSLVLELSSLVAEAKKRDAALAGLQTSLVALEASGTPAALVLRDRIAAVLSTASTTEMAALGAEADALVEKEAQAAAAAARRQAVLGALSTMGYEVRETMEATWAQDGRVVLRKPGASDYGVEVGAPPDASRLQVRLVGSDRPSTPRDARRDADQETIWCGEFDRLREHLASLGDELIVERALEAGAQPVRTVSLPGTVQVEAEIRAARPQARSLR